MEMPKRRQQTYSATIASLGGPGTPWRSAGSTLSGERSRVCLRMTRPARVCLLLLVLSVLAACENRGQPSDAEEPTPWPQAAIVADLSALPNTQSAETALSDLHAIGFDTVLFDARVTPPSQLKQWLETAQAQQLRSVVRIGEPGEVLRNRPGDSLALPESLVTRADGLIVLVDDPTDLESARKLKAALRSTDSATSLIAQETVEHAAGGASPAGVFEAMLLDKASQHILSLLSPAGTPPSEFAARYQKDDTHVASGNNPAHWHLIPHCRAGNDRRCSEDIRLLVLGFLLAPAPVTGVIDGSYWRDVYASLIQLRKQTPLLRTGTVEWYAADDEAGVLAYRITNDEGQTIMVAVNLADKHHELPLPFGFMAVSKIQLWASYDPLLRELVTSRPVALPARSTVVVIRD